MVDSFSTIFEADWSCYNGLPVGTSKTVQCHFSVWNTKFVFSTCPHTVISCLWVNSLTKPALLSNDDTRAFFNLPEAGTTGHASSLRGQAPIWSSLVTSGADHHGVLHQSRDSRYADMGRWRKENLFRNYCVSWHDDLYVSEPLEIKEAEHRWSSHTAMESQASSVLILQIPFLQGQPMKMRPDACSRRLMK